MCNDTVIYFADDGSVHVDDNVTDFQNEEGDIMERINANDGTDRAEIN